VLCFDLSNVPVKSYLTPAFTCWLGEPAPSTQPGISRYLEPLWLLKADPGQSKSESIYLLVGLARVLRSGHLRLRYRSSHEPLRTFDQGNATSSQFLGPPRVFELVAPCTSSHSAPAVRSEKGPILYPDTPELRCSWTNRDMLGHPQHIFT
jgi:hypothetical protein